jgi:hypothetical protein
VGGGCPIVLGIKWSNTKITKIKYMLNNLPPIGKSTDNNKPKIEVMTEEVLKRQCN